MNKQILTLALLLVFSISGLAVPKLDKVLSPGQMKKDIDYFFDFVERIHPNMYAFTPKEKMDQRREELYEKCSVPLTFKEFLQHFLQLNDLFDGHTGIQLWSVLYRRVKDPVFFPKPVQLRNGSLFLMQQNNYPGEEREIVSINGVSGEDIYTTLFRTLSAENVHARELQLAGSFAQRLYYLAGIEAPFELAIKQAGTKELDALVFQGVDSWNIRNAYIGAFGCPFRNFRVFPEESIAVIDYNSCKYKLHKKAWRKNLTEWANHIFNELEKQNIEHLFIDISRNGGGNSGANKYLLERLVTDTIKLNLTITYKVSNELYKYKFRAMGKKSFRKEFGCNGDVFVRNETWKTPNKSPSYNGNVYLIQGANTYSAGADFSAAFIQSEAGIVIGEETGGQPDEFNEPIPEIRLPFSKFGVQCSWKYYDSELGEHGRGWLPDVPIVLNPYKTEHSLEDLQGFLKEIEAYKSGRKVSSTEVKN